MSFRNRLALFFVLIVIVPMLAVTFLLFRLIAQSENGKANAAISAQHDVAKQLFGGHRDDARKALEEILGNDRVFVASLEKDDRHRASKRVRQLEASRGIERVVLVRKGRVALRVGDRTAIAPAVRQILSSRRRPLGELQVSTVDALTYAREVRRITGLHAVVRDGSRVLASTLPGLGRRELPLDGGEIKVGGHEYRAVSFSDPSPFEGQRLRVSTLRALGATSSKIRDGRITAVSILLGFFLIAIACAVLVSRTLQQQIASFLAAARRLAAGDFSAKVPTVGNDEFAELGQEFNKMSAELESRLLELEQERKRMQDSMLRLGEAVGSNLDRDALLELVVRTAVEGVGADAGRASVYGADGFTLEERSRVGILNGLEHAVSFVELQAMHDGNPRETVEGDANAIAHPLRDGDDNQVVGVVSVGRTGKPFTHRDRDLVKYLAGQAARSIENVQLYTTATTRSITDELTGLSNRRAFDDALAAEVERGRRYGAELGLVLLDIDNFKSINDTYLHQTGDIVLREVARVLREESREVDLPARYGGEELAVIVPGTGLEGAFNLAERIRTRIAGLEIPRIDGKGTISVTTSCGVAAVPPTAANDLLLVAAADRALYEAKGTGKNKSVRAR